MGANSCDRGGARHRHDVAAAAQTTTLTTMVFQGMQNLPQLAAKSQGFFAKRGLNIDIRLPPDSNELRDGLAQGRYHGKGLAAHQEIADALTTEILFATPYAHD